MISIHKQVKGLAWLKLELQLKQQFATSSELANVYESIICLQIPLSQLCYALFNDFQVEAAGRGGFLLEASQQDYSDESRRTKKIAEETAGDLEKDTQLSNP